MTIQSPTVQRKAVRLLRYQSHLAIDGIFDGLPDAWAAIVLRHAVRDHDGILRITPAAKARILRDCERALLTLESGVVATINGATDRAARLVDEAVS